MVLESELQIANGIIVCCKNMVDLFNSLSLDMANVRVRDEIFTNNVRSAHQLSSDFKTPADDKLRLIEKLSE